MNNPRRNQIARAISQLKEKKSYIEDILSDEQECLDNMPENLQNSERYTAMEEAVGYLEDALSSIDEAIENLQLAQDV